MKTTTPEISNSWIAQELKRRCAGKDIVGQLHEYMSLLRDHLLMIDYCWQLLRDAGTFVIGQEFDAWHVGGFTRDGNHIYNEHERPFEYIPHDHCSVLYRNPTDRTTPQEWIDENVLIQERRFFIHCPLCGAAIAITDYTKTYAPVPDPLDLVIVRCPRFLPHGQLVWAEGYNAIPRDIKSVGIEHRQRRPLQNQDPNS